MQFYYFGPYSKVTKCLFLCLTLVKLCVFNLTMFLSYGRNNKKKPFCNVVLIANTYTKKEIDWWTIVLIPP